MNRTRCLSFALVYVLLAPVIALAGDVQTDGSFVSTVATGTPPLAVSSTTGVANLNADLVDGVDGVDLATKAELATGGSGVTVHWENLTNVPDDGVLEINQDCASGGGCFVDDFPGFPVTIFHSGSYRLTSDLDLTAESSGASGIDIATSEVTIDLNGFTLFGQTTCSGTPVTSCSPTGTGDGIRTGSNTSITIRNGVIRGMPRSGVNCGGGCRVEGVTVTGNGGSGITVINKPGIVRNCQTFRNAQEGIRGEGIIRDNSSEGNGTYGIFSQPGSTVIGNSVRGNGGNGIRCFSCVMLDNAILSNEGFGIELGGGAAYGRNMIYDNTLGARDGAGLQVDTNLCATASACG